MLAAGFLEQRISSSSSHSIPGIELFPCSLLRCARAGLGLSNCAYCFVLRVDCFVPTATSTLVLRKNQHRVLDLERVENRGLG